MANIFQGERVRLRAIELSDWEDYYAADLDTDMARETDAIPFPSSREAHRRWAEEQSTRGDQNDEFRFGIERVADGVNVGTLNTHHCNLRCGTFMYGIAIFPQHRRSGYASDAIRLTLHYFFGERRYQKVNAEVYSFNEGSLRLHERLGFTLEGRLRRMIYTNGEFHDALIYGMTREEFEARW